MNGVLSNWMTNTQSCRSKASKAFDSVNISYWPYQKESIMCWRMVPLQKFSSFVITPPNVFWVIFLIVLPLVDSANLVLCLRTPSKPWNKMLLYLALFIT